MIPKLDKWGNLPPGSHLAAWEAIKARFGHGSEKRRKATERLERTFQIFKRTRHFKRLLIFGSYVTAAAEPNDVDCILVVERGASAHRVDAEAANLLDSRRARRWLQVDVLVYSESDEKTVAHFIRNVAMIDRSGRRRGIVEVVK